MSDGAKGNTVVAVTAWPADRYRGRVFSCALARTLRRRIQRIPLVLQGCRPVMILVLAALVALGVAGAQGHGGGGGRGPGGGAGMGGHGPGFPGGPGSGPGGPGSGPGVGGPGGGGAGGTAQPGRGPLQRGPAGRWWDNEGYAHSVGLTEDQQRRMDGVFAENRAALIGGLDTLHKAESRLSAVAGAEHPDESALNAEIESVAQARASLEKANAHMLLQLRNELTQEQLNRLDRLK